MAPIKRLVFLVIFPILAFSVCCHAQGRSEDQHNCGYSIPLDSRFFTPHALLNFGPSQMYFLIDTGTRRNQLNFGALGLSTKQSYASPKFLSPAPNFANERVVDPVIGTELLSQYLTEFHFSGRQQYIFLRPKDCMLGSLSDDYESISQRGFYPSKPGGLNMPIVYIHIDGLAPDMPAVLDSGLHEWNATDSLGSIRINYAFKRRLEDARIPLKKGADVPYIDCRGDSRSEPTFTISSTVITITNGKGKMRWRETDFGQPVFEVATNLPYDPTIGRRREECVPEMSEEARAPLAFIGAFYLMRWGTSILDPFSKKLWIPRNLRPASPAYRALTVALGQDGQGKWQWGVGKGLLPQMANRTALNDCKTKAGRDCRGYHTLSPFGLSCLAIVRSRALPENRLYYATNSAATAIDLQQMGQESERAVRDCERKEQATCDVEIRVCNE